MGYSGSASYFANDLVLECYGAVPNQFGIFYYGPNQIQVPFGDGFRCVGAGLLGTYRLPVQQADSFGDVYCPLDFNSPPASGGGGLIGEAQRILQRYNDLKDIIAILGVEELAEEDRGVVARARRMQRFLAQPFFVAEQFTGTPGIFVPREETVRSFKEIIEGKHDDLPEQAFYMVGGIDDVVERAKEIS